MDEIVRIEAEAMMARYVKRLRGELGSVVEGVYLVGSYALEDMRADSDVDFVTVLSRPLTSAEMATALKVHADIADCFSRTMDGLYAVAEELRSRPDQAQSLISFNEGQLQPTTGSPVDWETLRRYGVSVFGVAPEELRIFNAGPVLPIYSRSNLKSYWVPWVERAQAIRTRTVSRRQLAELAMWAVLGVPRLHAAIANGEIISKTGAGLYALETFDPDWYPVVMNSLAFRAQPDDESMESLADLCGDALAFTQMVIAEAQKLPG